MFKKLQMDKILHTVVIESGEMITDAEVIATVDQYTT